MRPPHLFQVLIGNPVVSLSLMLGALFVIWLWFNGGVDGWTTIGAIIVASTAAKAAERYNAYSAWKREWEGAGNAGSGLSLPRLPGLRVILALGSWGLLAGLALDGAKGDPVLEIAIGVFWFATAIVGVMAIYRLARPKRASRSVTVSVALPVSMRSASVREALANLPAHVRLFRSDR